VSELTFTGERLHDQQELFGVDLARHRAAYQFAIGRAGSGSVLDLGCGTGYGTAEIAAGVGRATGLDRVAPLPASRTARTRFVQADLNAMPLAPRSFDLIVSFQVIEHLEDPTAYLSAISRTLRSDGEALITTPNVLMSVGVNPYHVHEYEADELQHTLESWFWEVEVLGIGASEPVRRYEEARARRIRRIMRLDPLGLRDRLPRSWIEFLFGRLAILVRRGVKAEGELPDVTPADFPIGAVQDDCLDLLAICRSPR
jgi:SAM-dependent methyltransferase